MSELFAQIKQNLKKVAIFCSLFLGVFVGAWYLVNFDFSPNQTKLSFEEKPVVSAEMDAELKKRLGSTVVSFESYAAWAKRRGLQASNSGLDNDPDKDGLLNYLEYVHGTKPLEADTDKDGFSDKQELANGYDPDAPGEAMPTVEFAISKIGVDAPMVWSKSEDEKATLKDLENGLSHFYKTAAPGQNGNAIISGHSSNYFWAKGNYNHIFKDLNDLEKGDVITVRTVQANGRVVVYTYKVNDKFITLPDDQRVFAETKNPTLTLSTCWPIGTTLKRVIIKAELAK